MVAMLMRKRCQTPSIALPSEAHSNTLPLQTLAVTLPVELLDVIFRLACKGSGKGPELLDVDIKTARSFALVSKPLYNLVVPFLYTHVRLTKPSDLLLYARTVSIQPSLGKHTKTLWIGPDEAHVEGEECWPLNKDCTAIKSSITEARHLPRGVQIGAWWSFAAENSESESEIEKAARVIIREACRTVGNSRYRPGTDLQSGGKLSSNGKKLDSFEGHLRVYQIQQCLDTFLKGERDKQDAGQVPNYHSSTPLRTYATFDSFDHPVLYDRSKSAPVDARDDWESLQRSVVFDDFDYSVRISDSSDRAEASHEPSRSDQDESQNKSVLRIAGDRGEEFEHSLASVVCGEVVSGKPTLASLVLMSRIILAESDNLRCLALTSYLQMAVCGGRFGPKLRQLHLLTVGPPARRYQRALSLNHRGLDSVRRLRIWEWAPSEAVFDTVGFRKVLRALESLEYTWSAPWGNSFDDENDFGTSAFANDAASPSLALLRAVKSRLFDPQAKPVQLTVWANHDRMADSEPSELEELASDPRIELNTLPFGFEEDGTFDHGLRLRALARVRERWEKECQEVLALPPK